MHTCMYQTLSYISLLSVGDSSLAPFFKIENQTFKVTGETNDDQHLPHPTHRQAQKNEKCMFDVRFLQNCL